MPDYAPPSRAASRHEPSPRDLTPLERLLHAYDLAITACRSREARAAYRHIATLRAAHPCDTPAAASIDGLYAYCERAVLSGDYLGAAHTLTQLRSAWQAADHITHRSDRLGARCDDGQPDHERDTSAAIGA
jgi:hypothetical protein